MKSTSTHQIVISGVGGQGVLFITGLLADAAIAKGLPVFTSETHGMAQRGGTVISHLKVGACASPLIRPGRADGLIALKPESLVQHGGYLKPGGWAAVNSPPAASVEAAWRTLVYDADRMARSLGNPKAVNLLMVGFTLAHARTDDATGEAPFCTVEEIAAILDARLKHNVRLLQTALEALRTGAQGAVPR